MKTRIAAGMMALLLLLPLVVSCTKKETKQDAETTGQPTEEVTDKKYLDDLPETDNYDGEVIKTLVVEQDASNNFITKDPGNLGTSLQTEVFKSTKELEERFGIEMKYTAKDGYASGYQAFMNEIVATTMAGGETAYDLLIPAYWYGMILANEYYYDLNRVSTIDFSKPYWCESFNDNTTINGRRYAAVGDFVVGSVSSAYIVAINPQLVQSHGMTTPYAYYDNNLWTLETMLSMKSEVEQTDPSGNGQNIYGIVMSRQTLDGFYASSGLHIIENNEGDFTITKYSEQAEDLYQTLYHCMHKDDGVYYAPGIKPATEIFVEGKTLFGLTTLEAADRLRTMQSDYQFIVYPKYDSAQEEYVTGTSGCGVMAIPKTARDPEMTGLVMEALCASFRKNVIPTYIDLILEGRTARDPRSAAMLNQAIDTRYFDFGFVNHNAIGNIANFGIQMEQRYETMNSWYAKNETRYQGALESYLNGYIK